MSRRRDTLYLLDIQESAEALKRYTQDLDYEGFLASEVVRDAIERRIMIIGEAAASISDEFKQRYPHLPWHQAKGIRNQIVHRYFGLSWEVVYGTAIEDIPRLAELVARILDELEPSWRVPPSTL